MEHTAPVKLNYFVRRQTVEGWQILTRRIPDYELVLVTKGRGCAMIGGERFVLGTGDLVCFKPGVEHSIWVEQEPCMLFYGLHFEPSEPAQPLPFPDVLHLDAPMRLEVIFQKLHEVYYGKPYLYEWRQELLLQQLLCELLTVLHEKEEPGSIVRVRRALEYIHSDPCRKITLEDLLQQAGIRKTEFIQAFRSVTGTTPIRYILEQRLEIARALLLESRLPVADIAHRCGFSDPFYFSRCFSAHFAVSPREYRNEQQHLCP